MAEADRFVRAGQWNKERMTPSLARARRRVGIVGLGRIGLKVAERASGAGMQVSYTGPRRKPGKPYAFFESPRALAAAADVLILCCPSGPETYRLIDAEVLRALGPDGILINVSRGDVVDEDALIQALTDGLIGGAGLDVFAHEPVVDGRLLALENVVLAPHYASVTQATRQAIADALHDSISAFLDGEPIHDAALGFRSQVSD